MRKIEIIAIGNELLQGICVNSNAAYIGRRIFEMGGFVARSLVIPDQLEIIENELLEAAKRADLIITTGGLGPTVDDLCAQVFAGEGELIPNKVGYAPGRLIQKKSAMIVMLPGVPPEMKPMFEAAVISLVAGERQNRAIIDLMLLSEVEIDPLLRAHPRVSSGIYPAHGRIRLVLSSGNAAALQQLQKEIHAKFAGNIFKAQNGLLEEAVHDAFLRKKKRLACAESCSGGGLAAKITSISGCSEYFLGSIVSYSNAMKEKALGVSAKTLKEKGAVSAETVQEMAQGLLRITDADIALSISGISGPSGGSDQKPVGTVWIGIGTRGQAAEAHHFLFKGDRPVITEFAINTALALLLQKVQHVK